MVKLMIKDNETGLIHEYGTDRNDSLIIVEGALHYNNWQTGEGTISGAYEFWPKYPAKPNEADWDYADIGGEGEWVKKESAERSRLKDILPGIE